MSQKHTLDELNNLSREELITMVLTMQGQLDTLNDNIEKLIEQVRLANSYRFGKSSEKLSVIEGQMSFFDEADAMYDKHLKNHVDFLRNIRKHLKIRRRMIRKKRKVFCPSLRLMKRKQSIDQVNQRVSIKTARNYRSIYS